MKNLSDYQLIKMYLNEASQVAFKELLDRYFDHTKKVLFSSGMPMQDVGDVSQQVWIKIVRALPSYQDEGKFGALLTTVAKNLCNDYWRRNKNAHLYRSIDGEELDVAHDMALKANQSIERDYQNAEAISLLTGKLIPELNPELRLAFLLRHESEYWDNKQPLSWTNLGALFGVSREKAVEYFMSARDLLLHEHHDTKATEILDQEELGIFLVWTQSQRNDKKDKQTETRLAALVGIPVNTFKTRYKRARETLAVAFSSS